MADHVGWTGSRKILAGQRPPLVCRQAGATMMAFGIVIILVPHLSAAWLVTTPPATVIALLIHAAISAIALARLDTYPHSRFGAANMVTTSRAALAAVIGGIVLAGDAPHSSWTMSLFVAGAAAISLALDGIDGYLARRSGLVSHYGARFDMEVDALLIFLLTMAVFLQEKTGMWVLLIGLMRYGFLLLQASFRRLRGELPASHRRKVICVVQGASLCIALAPTIPHPLQVSLLAMALLSLTCSFAVDVLYLFRDSRRHRDES